MPGSKPKYVRVYDNGGPDVEDGSLDRYTVIFSGNFPKTRIPQYGTVYPHLAMNGCPFHPQMGICIHGEHNRIIDAPQGWPPAIGRKCHLGRRIPFDELPNDCKIVVLSNYAAYWSLPLGEINKVVAEINPRMGINEEYCTRWL